MSVSLIRRLLARRASRGGDNGIEVTLDAEGRVVSASRSFELLLGYSPHEGLHLSIADIVHPEDIATARELLHRVRMEGGAAEVALRIRDATGGWHGAVAYHAA